MRTPSQGSVLTWAVAVGAVVVAGGGVIGWLVVQPTAAAEIIAALQSAAPIQSLARMAGTLPTALDKGKRTRAGG